MTVAIDELNVVARLGAEIVSAEMIKCMLKQIWKDSKKIWAVSKAIDAAFLQKIVEKQNHFPWIDEASPRVISVA